MGAYSAYTETLTIFYDDNTNTFEDDYGNVENSVVDIMSQDDMIYYKRVGGTYYRDIGGVSYEIVFPMREPNRTLYYDIDLNVMMDEDCFPIFNIFSIISPNDLYLFKKNKESVEVRGVNDGFIELIWPDPDEEELND